MNHDPKRAEAGFALILALLALMLLTFLGLTLAATTSSELLIATNHRWSQQAYYNAEAGLELGKKILQAKGAGNFGTMLPAARTTASGATCTPDASRAGYRCWFSSTATHLTPAAPFATATRNFENNGCDDKGNGMGLGVVLDDGTACVPGSSNPCENLTNAYAGTLNGAFTLWIRREQVFNADGSLSDSERNDSLVLTAEGTAPFPGPANTTTFAASNVARRTLEQTVSTSATPGTDPCGTRSGQSGNGPEGANFSGCSPVTGPQVGTALGGSNAGSPDTGVR